ncbi:MAG: M23 family metallopeptidase [Leptonema sp. (in: Bacteria)]|nr:M23 family metallopeptidase [Leptonema sp. (in: bacteria)]
MLSIALSVYGYYLHQDYAIEVKHQQELFGINYTAAHEIDKESRNLLKYQDNLRSNLQEIARISGYSSNRLNLIPSIKFSRQTGEHLLKAETLARLGPNADYLHSTYSVAGLNQAVTIDIRLIESLKLFLEKGFGAYSHLPLGRPLTDSYRDTSDYGIRIDPITGMQMEFHSGLDMAGSRGTPIKVTAPGEVEKVLSWDAGYGNAVIVRHAFGFHTLYGHMERTIVRPGQRVYQGMVVGYMGATGRVTGVHVHYEVWNNQNKRTDPEPFVCAQDLNSKRCKIYHSKQG